MMSKILFEFWSYVYEADKIDKEIFDTKKLEFYYIKILNFIKLNLNYKEEFIQCFKIMLLRDQSNVELFEFCLRELNWVEIKVFLIELLEKEKDITKLAKYNRILNVFDEEWDNYDLYDYYSNKACVSNAPSQT